MLQMHWKVSSGHPCPKLFMIQACHQDEDNGDVITKVEGDIGTAIAKHMLEDKETLS